MDKREQSYFEGFSGHKVTDDCWWDLWVVYHGTEWIDSQHYSEENAQSEFKRLSEKFPDTDFHIHHIENAGYGDLVHKGFFGRWFPKEMKW